MHTEPPELFYWLALGHINDLGSISTSRLLQQYGSARDIFNTSSLVELKALGLKESACRQIIDIHASRQLRRAIELDLRWLSGLDHHLITIIDEDYPRLLREIPDPPSSLFVQGNRQILSAPQLAVVGSRKASRTGLESAFSFAMQLSNAGLVVTSGLALGIDSESHRGAMRGASPTIAVLGSGLCCLYPARHRQLAEQILADGGVLISEFPLYANALPHHFPRRNRIISGLSLGTLVVEAELRSGSLITARMALEQNREVFALPGSIYNSRARGCHWLIKQGAKLVENLNDILEEIHVYPDIETVGDSHGTSSSILGNRDQRVPQTLNDEERQLLEYLDLDPVTVDSLVEKSQLPITLITSTLVSLELKGIARAERSGYALIPEELRR